MILLLASILWAVLIAMLLVRAVRQYGYYEVIGPDSRALDEAPSIAAIVPARDEAANIRRCIESLLAQDYPRDRLSIVVVDDDSSDATASIVNELARRDARLTLRAAGPLPDGWLGKPHACWVGARAAGEARWLCFCDADTVATPALLRTAVLAARERGVGLLSLEPFQELVSFWERLLLPCGFFLIAFTQDVRKANDPRDPQAHANGQFMLIDRAAYEAAGTFEGVRGQIAEDSAMARRIKRGGRRVAVLGTKGLIRARMYRDFRSLWQGLSRQAGQLLGGAIKAVAFAIMAIIMALCAIGLPILCGIDVARRADFLSIAALAIAAAASLALLGTHVGAARYFKIPVGYGLLFPIGYILGSALLLHCAAWHVQDQVVWKGRKVAALGRDTGSSPDGSSRGLGHAGKAPMPR